MSYKKFRIQSAGFSLIELIVALGLFTVVSTISITSLITLMDNNRQLRDDQALITNIVFVLDMMSREIRNGYNYYCAIVPPSGGGSDNLIPNESNNRQDCTDIPQEDSNDLHGISFLRTESMITEGDERMVFYYDKGNNMLYRRIGDGASQALVSDQVEVIDAYFFVTGTDEFTGTNDAQPTVTIFLEVRADDGREYQLQTTLTQRLLDI